MRRLAAYLFVFALFAAVVFRVEFWPLSDFRLFAGGTHPENKATYRLAVVHKGEERWLFAGADARRNNHMDHLFQNVARREPAVNALPEVAHDYGHLACERGADFVRLYEFRFRCPNPECQGIEIERRLLGEVEAPCR